MHESGLLNPASWLAACQKVFVILCLFIHYSCEKALPTLESFNQEVWKEDKNACQQKRTLMLSALREQKNKLQGLSETQIIKLLGRPDQNELYKRNQKFYYYYLQPGPSCAPDSLKTLKLVLRFNAMGRAKEISIE